MKRKSKNLSKTICINEISKKVLVDPCLEMQPTLLMNRTVIQITMMDPDIARIRSGWNRLVKILVQIFTTRWQSLKSRPILDFSDPTAALCKGCQPDQKNKPNNTLNTVRHLVANLCIKLICISSPYSSEMPPEISNCSVREEYHR